ncbi:fungal trichothecene efflux pump-domain-containing protein [Ilyonectria robusta]|uniref:fungal trichothecene efflux pump-domain-containing protein n=1 Tax=Ilyonectria robusta TaxID=1079257 RepID=UPI001E8E8E99|nr:fungal trichothecene efflux pump-domain-containing protein [Ilyonectria robusta]KAH8736418.1 fungal trichothecene efflux pump-domain-containing protein [Ilyonectria robusta]
MPHHDRHASDDENTFEVEEDELPPGYFTSPFFIGSMTGIGLGLMAGDANIIWVALTYTLTSAVTLTIIGRVTDIFGRRWVFVGGAFLGIIGSIVCATAQSVNSLIGGMTITGIAAATQLSYYYVMGELVPMKYRLIGNAFCYSLTIPGSGLAPDFDYIGTAVYTGGLLVLMMGLNWGGSVYPWKSAHVIGAIVSGIVGLVLFVLWESYAKLKEPLVPMHLFKNQGWNAATILSGLGASVYYAFALVWPSMVTVLYEDGDPMTAAWYSSFVGLFIIIGEVVGGVVAKPIGNLKLQCIVTVALSGIFFGATATSTPDSRVRATTFVALGTFFIGWAESLAITIVTIAAWDQSKLGSASGLAGSIRFFISSISATVYTVILSNRLTDEIARQVPKAVTAAGLPSSSVADFITGLSTGTGFDGIPGVTDSIAAVGVRAYKEANALAYRTVFLASIAFSGVALIASFMLPNVDSLLTGKVASTLHKGRKDEKMIGAGDV